MKTWNISEGGIIYNFKLLKDKLVMTQVINEKDFIQDYQFQNIFDSLFPIISNEVYYDIFKEITKLPKPKNLSAESLKKWDFWKAFDNSHITKERIFVEENRFLCKNKFGFSEGYLSYDKKEYFTQHQSFENFFFSGPLLYNIPITVRKRMKQEIFKGLNGKTHNITLDDSFLIFNYNKINKIEYEHIDGITGVYFKVIDGKVTVGGWDNPRDGGENYSSVEYLWYNLKTRIPSEFHDKIDTVKKILLKAIEQNKKPGKEQYTDSPPSEN